MSYIYNSKYDSKSKITNVFFFFRKRCEDLTAEFKLYAKDNLSLNETLAGLRHEFSNIR